MPRGKRSTSESSNVPETVAFADEEVKTKSGAAKVTLVKPLQTGETMPADDEVKTVDALEITIEKEPAAAGKLKKPRPKVGRSSSARGKKVEAKDAKAEKKEKKPRKKREAAPEQAREKPEKTPAAEKAPVPEKDIKAGLPAAEKEEKGPAAPEAEKTPAPAPEVITAAEQPAPVAAEVKAPESAIASRLPGEEQMELPIDWNPDQQPQPQSFKVIFISVILFVVINLGIMMIFNHVHRSKEHGATTAATSGAPSIPALPAIPSMTSAPPAPAKAPSGVDVGSSSGQPAPQDTASAPPFAPLMEEKPVVVSPLPPVVPPVPADPFASLTSHGGHAEPASVSAPVTPVSVTSVPETAAPASAEHEETASAPPPAAATAVTPMPAGGQDAATKAASTKELLSILDKN